MTNTVTIYYIKYNLLEFHGINEDKRSILIMD